MSDHVDTDAVRRLADAATPGPWFAVSNDLVGGLAISTVDVPMSERAGQAIPADLTWCDNDAEFIAAVRTLVPALCNEVDRLRAALRECSVQAWHGRAEAVRGIVETALGEQEAAPPDEGCRAWQRASEAPTVYSQPLPERCPTCGSDDPITGGCVWEDEPDPWHQEQR